MATATVIFGTDPSSIMAGVAKASSKMVGEVFSELSKDAKRFVKNQNRTIKPKLQAVADGAIRQALDLQEERRVRPSDPYRAAGGGRYGRLTGQLAQALSGSAVARVVNGRLDFGDMNALAAIAPHIYRINFGTTPSSKGQASVTVGGARFPVPTASLYGRQSSPWTMPTGVVTAGGRFYPGGRPGGGQEVTGRVRAGTPAGMPGQFFLSDAGVYALRGSIKAYKDHVENLIDKSLETGKQKFATYNIVV